MSEQKTAQLRVKRKAIIAEGAGGTIFWATPTRARLLIDAGAVELMNADVPDQAVVGPSETKPQEPAEKKSFAAVPAGLSTDSAPSSQSGAVAQSSASEVAPASPKRRSARQKKQTAESLPSTTDTE